MKTTVDKQINITYRKEHPILGFDGCLRQYYFMGSNYWLIQNKELNLCELWNKFECISDERQVLFKGVAPSDDLDVLTSQMILIYLGFGQLMPNDNPCLVIDTIQDIYNTGYNAGEQGRN